MNQLAGGGLVTESCPTLGDPMDCSALPSTCASPSVPGFSTQDYWIYRGYSQPRDWSLVSWIAGRFFFFFFLTSWAIRDAPVNQPIAANYGSHSVHCLQAVFTILVISGLTWEKFYHRILLSRYAKQQNISILCGHKSWGCIAAAAAWIWWKADCCLLPSMLELYLSL